MTQISGSLVNHLYSGMVNTPTPEVGMAATILHWTILHPHDPDLYVTLAVVDGYVLAQFCRRYLWRRQPSGTPGPAANRPGTPVTRLLATRRYDAPLHLVANTLHDLMRDEEL
jgi:hypothetical protein